MLEQTRRQCRITYRGNQGDLTMRLRRGCSGRSELKIPAILAARYTASKVIPVSTAEPKGQSTGSYSLGRRQDRATATGRGGTKSGCDQLLVIRLVLASSQRKPGKPFRRFHREILYAEVKSARHQGTVEQPGGNQSKLTRWAAEELAGHHKE